MGNFILRSNEDRASGWTIGDVEFDTAPMWIDKYKTIQRQGSRHDLIGGGSRLQVFDRSLSNQPITLKLDGKEGSLHKDRAEDLKALADTGEAVNFTPGTGESPISVVFDYSKDNPLDLEFFPDGQRTMMVGTIYLLRA